MVYENDINENLSILRYEVEKTFPKTDFSFNRKEHETEARIYLDHNYKQAIEVDLSNIEIAVTEAIWSIKQILHALDS